MPSTDSTAPPTSILRNPVNGTSTTSLMLNRTMAMITTSSMNPTRHDRYVVTKPPSRGPIAAPTAAAAPTKA